MLHADTMLQAACTMSASGQYNLDLVSSDHGIADAAANSVTSISGSGTTPTTGTDHTYTVSTVRHHTIESQPGSRKHRQPDTDGDMYNLDLVSSDHGIADAAANPLTGTTVTSTQVQAACTMQQSLHLLTGQP